MPDILAFTIFICIFTFGEYIAMKTKAAFSTVLVVSLVLLVGFWLGLPAEIFDNSVIMPIGGVLIGILITGMGNLLDFEELKRQWKTVVVSAITVVIVTAGVFFIGQLIIGRDLAMAGAPIFAGSSTASLIMNTTLSGQGRDTLALFIILMLVCQNFVGIPVASLLLKKAARVFLKDTDQHKLYLTGAGIKEGSQSTKRKLLELPAELNRPSMVLAKLGIVTVLAFYTAELTNGVVNYIVIALIYGTIFTELGFLEKQALDKTNANGFILFACIMILFADLPKANPAQLVSLIFPLIVLLGIGVIGACISGAIIGKLFKVEPYMAICMCLTCTFGFPTTMFMSDEVSAAVGKTPEEVELIGNYLRPKMITAGFITGIISIILAGFVANII